MPAIAASELQNPLNVAGNHAPAVIQPGNDGVALAFLATYSARNMCDRRFAARSGTRGDNLRFSVVEPKSRLPLASGRNFWKAYRINPGAAFPALMHPTRSFRFAPAAAARLCQHAHFAKSRIAGTDGGRLAGRDLFFQRVENDQRARAFLDRLDLSQANGFIQL
jgi:hypothetical protein